LAVGVLGAVNLFGAIYLGSLFGSPALAGKTLVGLLGFVSLIPTPYALHSTPYTLHHTPFTLQPQVGGNKPVGDPGFVCPKPETRSPKPITIGKP
jgi:hypothetical protein